MAKKSHRRLLNHETPPSGCISGLIGIFDFRHARSTRKLLSDKRHGSSRHASADTAILRGRLKSSSNSDNKHRGKDTNVDSFSDDDETEALTVGTNKTSVKKLIEEDMSNEQQTEKQVPNASKEQIQSNPEYRGDAEKDHKHTKETCKVACDIHIQDTRVSATLESQEYYQTNSAKRLSLLDITSLMEEFCCQIQQHPGIRLHHESEGDSCGALEYTDLGKYEQGELDMHKTEKHSVLQEKLSEAAVTFLNQKLVDTKQFKEDGAIHQSKHFIDALEILNSNKELLLKVLLDSNSLGVRYTREVQDTHTPLQVEQEKLSGEKLPTGIASSETGKELACRKEVQKNNIHNFFRKKDKSQKKNSSEESDCCQVSNRIVVLKPKSTGNQNSSTANSPISSPQSHYSLKNQGWGGRLNSQFSLGEIKKKLKNTMGENRKDRQWFFMDGMLHKIPNKHQVSGVSGNTDPENISGKDVKSKNSSCLERTTKPSNSSGEKKTEKPKPYNPRTAHEVASTTAAGPTNPTITRVGSPKQREANIYLEAKKHLEDILTGVGEDGGFPNEKSAKTLGKILSLPEYTSSPIWSPGIDGEHGFITAQMRLSSNGSFRIVNENIWRFKLNNNPNQPSPSRKNIEIQQDAHGDNNPDIIIKGIDSKKPDSLENVFPDSEICESICSKEDSVPEGNGESMEETNIVSREDRLPLEINSNTSIISTSTTTKVLEEEEFNECLRPSWTEDGQQPSSSLCSLSSNSLHLQKVESLENINDPPERPSPVSVLEPFYDDVNSPTTTGAPHVIAEVQIERLHFEDEEDDCATMVITSSDVHNHPEQSMEDNIPPFMYVTAVLQAAGMKWGEPSERNNFSELLLDPSLFDEAEQVQGQDCGERKLLFDCTNEVLTELYKRYYGSSSWVAFVNPDIRPAPKGSNIIQEVWEGVNWNLTPPPMPHTLDQIIGKDMEKCRTWMDLRSDVEVIGNEMVDIILGEIVEDTLFELHS